MPSSQQHVWRMLFTDSHRCMKLRQRKKLNEVSAVCLSDENRERRRHLRTQHLATRHEALKGPKEELLMLSIFPRVREWLVNRAALAAVGAEKLNFLPDPPRSYQGTMAFNQNYGLGAKKYVKTRAVTALPLLMLGLLAHRIFSNILSQAALQALDWRLVNVAAAKTAGFAVALTLTIPTLAIYYVPESSQRLMINAVWQAFPVLTGVVHYLLRKYAVDYTTTHGRIYNVEADLSYVRLTVWAFAGISTTFFNWTRFFSGTYLARISFPDGTTLTSIIFLGQDQLDLVTGTRLLFQADEIACFAAAVLWLAFLTRDLKEAEMASISWLKAIALAIAGTYLLGPGAVVALTWWWRENILATKKAKGSVIGRI
ncbi:uncharacterized protein A1O5_06546 [Cladophialophora psammophila CBS 110553]|uniref:Uncharacterized protein n=1 Tax=Cladophialophora psammophila CBS 110553 TaxID=1182543 RepID=W9WQK8_9EURO|nr:uncharacterized protein A1O5_06546 [Cladophialophora psammophila CBS 110553]EXJ70477.1 hypothetical protein A1O5_06546 [Cladophialophora psammophila CBS 110553]